MIKNIKLIRSVGQFPHVNAGKNIDLGDLTLCFGENGRGKTTLMAILRSLAEGDASAILERKRIDAIEEPKVVLGADNNATPIVFQNGAWNRLLPGVIVFDDAFVEANVYSGLTVSPKQRQNLHDLILGPQAVQLQMNLDRHVEEVERCNRVLRTRESEIQPFLPEGFTVERLCSLELDPNLDDQITETRKTLNAAEEQDALKTTGNFELSDLPNYDTLAVEKLLSSTLDTLGQEALLRIQQHMASLGRGGEAWIAEGMRYVSGQAGDKNRCPLCTARLDKSTLVRHFRAYFSQSYSDLKQRINDSLHEHEEKFGARLQATFEQELRRITERRQFWGQFFEIEPILLDTARIYNDCETALNAIANLLRAKQLTPLEKIEIPSDALGAVQAYGRHVQTVAEIKEHLAQANQRIEALKVTVDMVSKEELRERLSQLEAIKIRYADHVDRLCRAYLQEQDLKSTAQHARDDTRGQLNQHRKVVFPSYQTAVNDYLDKFGTGFRLSDLKPENRRSGSTTTYGARVGERSVDVGTSGDPTDPSFGSVLSGGDRTTLAFAFFLASLHQHPAPGDSVVAIDDPISSMDSGRTLATAQEIRKLVGKFGQVIVLSHDKRFLLEISQYSDAKSTCALQVVRTGDGSTLAIWDLDEESLTQHDRRSREFSTFLEDGSGNIRQIAQDIRPHLENYLRVTCPSVMRAETKLGQFMATCEERIRTPNEILSEQRFNELGEILEFAHKYHHDANPDASSQTISQTELTSFVKRTLRLTVP